MDWVNRLAGVCSARRLTVAAAAVAVAALFTLAVRGCAGTETTAQVSPAASHQHRLSRPADPLAAYRVAPGRYRFDDAQVSRDWLWLLCTARAHGWSGRLNGPATGLRTRAQQQRLYRLFLAGRGEPAFAPDGPSRHMISNTRGSGWFHAVDATRPQALIWHAGRLGVRLFRPHLPRETWHLEAVRPFHAPVGWPRRRDLPLRARWRR